MPKKTLTDVSVSDAYLTLLADRGVDYWFANAGTDFAPLLEAYAKAQTLGTKVPTPITCPHENTAVHMAVGYYLVTGRPQAVMVHVNVGTANGLNGILNASRGNVPMLFTAGRTPTNEDTLHGHRSLDIHWTQEMFDQSGMVREAVKWDYELRNGAQLETVVDRALTIAMSEPRGPSYLALPREVLAEQMESFTYSSPTRHQPAAPHAPNRQAVDEAATLLAGAEIPMIITSWAGRDAGAWYALSGLAERHCIPVVQYRNRYSSIATDHPMHMGYDPAALMEIADVILVVDAAAPWLPAIHKPREDAKVIHLAADPMHGYVPIRGHECDIALACGTAEGLEVLDEALTAHAATAKSKIDARRGKLAERHAELREGWAATLEKVKCETPMHAAWVSHCISQVKDDDTVVIRESALAQPFFKVTQPGTCFNAGAASGLGWGMGAALGAKLATPDKLVIGTEGDGAYMFSNPVSAHYVAAEQDLPILTVMFNNGIWNAVRRSTVGLTPDGYAAKSNRPPATMLDGINKYEKVVEMVDGYGERVTDPDDLIPALERGIKAVMVERRQALINVVCSP